MLVWPFIVAGVIMICVAAILIYVFTRKTPTPDATPAPGPCPAFDCNRDDIITVIRRAFDLVFSKTNGFMPNNTNGTVFNMKKIYNAIAAPSLSNACIVDFTYEPLAKDANPDAIPNPTYTRQQFVLEPSGFPCRYVVTDMTPVAIAPPIVPPPPTPTPIPSPIPSPIPTPTTTPVY